MPKWRKGQSGNPDGKKVGKLGAGITLVLGGLAFGKAMDLMPMQIGEWAQFLLLTSVAFIAGGTALWINADE